VFQEWQILIAFALTAPLDKAYALLGDTSNADNRKEPRRTAFPERYNSSNRNLQFSSCTGDADLQVLYVTNVIDS
jgi:hypothetical protein